MNQERTSTCQWPKTDLDIAYHDQEWGVPLHEDHKLFEFLILEGAQAGLSWSTILKKREGYRRAFDQFIPDKIARYNKRKIESLIKNEQIVRNRLKIESAVKNARAYLNLLEEYPTFDQYIWQFVDGKPIVNKFKSLSDIPAKTPLSDTLSKELKKRGFNFVGSTICYAFMQATGLVNDHTTNCFRYKQIIKSY